MSPTPTPTPRIAASSPVIRRVMLVDDHTLFRSGLATLLSRREGLALEIIEAAQISDALALLREGMRPDLILLDIQMPGLNGLEGLRLLRRAAPNSSVAMLSGLNDLHTVEDALMRGADGFLAKSANVSEVHQAIERLLEGRRHFPQLEQSSLENSWPAPRQQELTPRQLEVLALMAEGLINKVIARRLNLAENTVRVHVAANLAFFGANTRMEAIQAARRQGLIG